MIDIVTSDRRNEWLAERRKGICASDAYACLTRPYSVYMDKAEGIRDEPDGEWVAWGNILEGAIVAAAAERIGVLAVRSSTLCAREDEPWIRATFDAFCGKAWDEDIASPLEAKNVGSFMADEWADGAPEKFRAQVQWQMLVCGASHGYIAALIGGSRLVWERIDRDDAYIARLVAAARDVWDRVQRREPPPVDGSDETRKAIVARFPVDTGKLIELPREALDIDEELILLEAQATSIDSKIKERKNRIRELIGDASIGTLPNGAQWSHKLQARAGHVVAPSSSRVLRRLKPKKEQATK